MNARLDMMNHDNVPAPLADCLRNAAASILRSPTFAKAPRMRQLLAFLIDAPAMASGGGARLYRTFCEALMLGGGADCGVADYRLKGGIRVEGRRVRACVRLVDGAPGRSPGYRSLTATATWVWRCRRSSRALLMTACGTTCTVWLSCARWSLARWAMFLCTELSPW